MLSKPVNNEKQHNKSFNWLLSAAVSVMRATASAKVLHVWSNQDNNKKVWNINAHTIDRDFKAITILWAASLPQKITYLSPFNSMQHVCCYGNKQTTYQFCRDGICLLIRSYLQRAITGGQHGKILPRQLTNQIPIFSVLYTRHIIIIFIIA